MNINSSLNLHSKHAIGVTSTTSLISEQIAVGLTSSLEVVVIVSHKLNAGPLHALVSHGGAFSSRPLSQHARDTKQRDEICWLYKIVYTLTRQ